MQVDPATKEGHIFVLAMVSPIKGTNTNSRGLHNFVIKPGDTKTGVFKNKHFPEREYIFKVETTLERNSSVTVHTTYSIEDKNEVIFYGQQSVSGWDGSNKASMDASVYKQ